VKEKSDFENEEIYAGVHPKFFNAIIDLNRKTMSAVSHIAFAFKREEFRPPNPCSGSRASAENFPGGRRQRKKTKISKK